MRAAPLGERRRDDREPGRSGERRADALDEARRDEQRPVVDEPAEAGGDHEDAKRDQEHAPAAEQVGGAAAEQQEAAVAEHVRAHDPLQRARREAEVARIDGQRDADHRDVERVQEEGAAEHEQGAPGAPAESSGTVIERVRDAVGWSRTMRLLERVDSWRPALRSAIVRSASYILVRPTSNNVSRAR